MSFLLKETILAYILFIEAFLYSVALSDLGCAWIGWECRSSKFTCALETAAWNAASISTLSLLASLSESVPSPRKILGWCYCWVKTVYMHAYTTGRIMQLIQEQQKQKAPRHEEHLKSVKFLI